MPFVSLKTPFDSEERSQRRHLMISDALTLCALFFITVALGVVTNYLYQSYASHQTELAHRWLMRGVANLREGKPLAAVDALQSALAYAPSQRAIQVELAEALAAAGRTQQATAYFNNLLETQPGDGKINLELGRLAARDGNIPATIDFYQKAIYGTWEGDGYVRRREARLELIHFEISHALDDQARSQLLLAAGNAPVNDLPLQVQIGRLMEQARDPSDALHLYRSVLRVHPTYLPALEGAGRSAFGMGRYLLARRFLDRFLERATADASSRTPLPQESQDRAQDRDQDREMLRETNHLLSLYPSTQISLRAHSERILTDRKIAYARFTSCAAAQSAPGSASAPASPPVSETATAKHDALSILGLATHLGQRLRPQSAVPAGPAPSPFPTLDDLKSRWAKEPASITAPDLEKHPELARTEIQLIYDTEKISQQVCGPTSGDNELLLRIAMAPNAVEEE